MKENRCNVDDLKKEKNTLVKAAMEEKLQAEIDLARDIQFITSHQNSGNKSIKNVRKNRKKEIQKNHRDIVGEEL